MIGFYVFGGGFGHLTRVKKVISQLNLTNDYLIITSNKHAFDLFETANVYLIELSNIASSKELAGQLSIVFKKVKFQEFYIDVFPQGILGELQETMFNNKPINLISRRLKWNNYKNYLSENIQIATSYILEELETEHYNYLNKYSKEIVYLNLESPLAATECKMENFWLIIHSSSKEELVELVEYAREMSKLESKKPKFVICSDQRTNLVDALFISDPKPYLNKASKIFSGAGFNTWHELKPYREKHECIPFNRRFDDQHWRSRQD